MTNEKNEKKDESDTAHRAFVNEIAVMFRKSYEEALALDGEVDKLQARVRHFDEVLKSEKNPQRRERIMTHQRFLNLEAAILNNEVIMKMGLAILSSLVAGVDVNIDEKKKLLDKHIAKRVGQLFGDNDETGYIQ